MEIKEAAKSTRPSAAPENADNNVRFIIKPTASKSMRKNDYPQAAGVEADEK